MKNKSDFFQDRINIFSSEQRALKARFNKISVFRFGIFIAFAVATLVFINLQILGATVLTSIVFVVSFVFLVKKHNWVKKELDLSAKLLKINQDEKNRLQFKFNEIWDGNEFANDSHPYSNDLDIFGRNSVFQLLNRAGTYRGVRRLVGWLLAPGSKNEVLERQTAVKELVPLIEWRQQLEAYAKNKFHKKENDEAFYQWLDGKDVIRIKPLYRILPYLLTFISIGLFIAYSYELVPLFALLLPFFVAGYFLYQIINYSRETYEMTLSGLQILESIEQLIKLIERQGFTNEYLLKVKSRLMHDEMVASDKINQLRKIFDWLSQRGNQIYMILNSIFLLDFLLLEKAESWRAHYKDEVSQWFEAVAEFEALSSLAAFSYANSQYRFPTIIENSFLFNGKRVGHPLIPDGSRVYNDFTMQGQGTACVITGSNMAGKSTFLRTIAVNAVLAFAGAPVCAQSLDISSFQVFTSMRTKDNLEENISSFYAELLRLKKLLELISDDRPTMYFLDEILKGTNSTDRHIGAESLILQLNEKNAFGLVSTHDLGLGKLEEENKKILNYNFSSSIVNEEIVFDYKLRKGICESTNASQLMSKIGIEIKSKDD